MYNFDRTKPVITITNTSQYTDTLTLDFNLADTHSGLDTETNNAKTLTCVYGENTNYGLGSCETIRTTEISANHTTGKGTARMVGLTQTKTYYYKIGENVSLSPLNADSANKAYYGREIAKNGDTYYNKTYEDENDAPEIYAVPVYLQSTTITPTDKGEDAHDYFILKIEWDQESAATNFTKWNKAENNKETDIIYITASRSTG